jgi:hypothetical protein
MMAAQPRLFRVNYGNGQVGDMCTLAEARRELGQKNMYPAFAFLEVYELGTADEPGDWFMWKRIKASRRGDGRGKPSQVAAPSKYK